MELDFGIQNLSNFLSSQVQYYEKVINETQAKIDFREY